jgi:hypothetical protein
MMKLAKNRLPLRKNVRQLIDWWSVPKEAALERRRDRTPLRGDAPDIDQSLAAATDWLMTAQDRSRSCDGGVARHYSLIDGWATSYPETSGYIVPTLLELARRTGRDELCQRARRVLDWLVSIQFSDGAFQGGPVDAKPRLPAVFDTGQILMGLAAGVTEFATEGYARAMRRAADWLMRAQAKDGSWPQEIAPFAMPGAKTYETHVAWGLIEAFRASGDQRYLDSALANVKWAIGLQRDNGWFERCCLTDHDRPLTHTLGYALRGVVEAYRVTRDQVYRTSAQKCADGLLLAVRGDGALPGRLDCRWQTAAPWSCLTGNVQIAASWLLLHRETGNVAYREAAVRANAFVRRTVRLDGPAERRGGVKGAFPVDGAYGRFQFLNWACKFFIDSHLLEQDLQRGDAAVLSKTADKAGVS